MPYKDSYVAKIREIVGHDFELVMPTSDVVIENNQGELLMIYNRDFDGWAFPGGYIEPEMSWQENAAREALEEAGVHADPEKLQLIGAISGRHYIAHYPNGDVAKLYNNVFLLQDWQDEAGELDATEIDAKKWMSLKTIDHEHLTFSGQAVYRVYRQYKATGTTQMLTINNELQRFIDAQDGRIVGVNSYNDAIKELNNGQKQTHWMWYVLPQLRGLGSSERATYYGLDGIQEARAYLENERLRQRLENIIKVTLAWQNDDPVALLGEVDAIKFQASLTIFIKASDIKGLYQQALDKYFDGQQHQATLELLE
ncbi:DUF1810 family protein [Leuconostoc carnosum]|uniref:DUF1810 family protein n=1 Tax=Leuconostoc carnosum TaxID=1252 RepID=UPI00123A2011|nr:DUF1810 family protein [Leuconostoc carnosum]KAA8369362.1 DUF1810 family protein [Leuconostoc carnosum]KAA8380380.1 DUF1810 family protein [Leuconostoc carnosum]